VLCKSTKRKGMLHTGEKKWQAATGDHLAYHTANPMKAGWKTVGIKQEKGVAGK